MIVDSAAGIKVLVIDDEEDFATTLASRLELRGMVVRSALSGEQGLELLRREPPEVILLDMRMPGLSGVEVLREVRHTMPGLPVIIITGHCSEQDFEKAQDLKVQGYHTKPLNFEKLLESIEQLNLGKNKA